jgi:hypothetical protein
MFSGDRFSIEIGMGDSEIAQSIGLHLRGGEGAAGVVADTIGHLRERALDTSTSKFFDPPAAVTNLQEWRASRDRAISQASDQSDDRTG